MNQAGKTVPADLPRVDFFHWVLVDIPADVSALEEGAASRGITPRGKSVGQTPHGLAGKNDYTGWFAGDSDMDLDADQLDLVQALQAGKYLTGAPATWGEGDWDGAPGGTPGDPPGG